MAKSKTTAPTRRGAYNRTPKKTDTEEKKLDPVFGARIRRWRFFFDNMTQGVLAEGADVSIASISNYEQGHDPSLGALRRIAGYFDIPVGMLIECDPDEAEPFWLCFKRADTDQRANIGKLVQVVVPPALSVTRPRQKSSRRAK